MSFTSCRCSWSSSKTRINELLCEPNSYGLLTAAPLNRSEMDTRLRLPGVPEDNTIRIPPQVHAVHVARSKLARDHIAGNAARLQTGLEANATARFVTPGILRARDVGKGRRMPFDKDDFVEVDCRVGQHNRPGREAGREP